MVVARLGGLTLGDAAGITQPAGKVYRGRGEGVGCHVARLRQRTSAQDEQAKQATDVTALLAPPNPRTLVSPA